MFRKLLKHDFKAVFRYWWLLLPTLPVLAFLLGLAVRYMAAYEQFANESIVFSLLMLLSVLFIVFAMILISASALVSPILSLVRFYKHFYTDEGYLTFTLPVKRSTLLLSKVVNAMIFDTMYVLLMGISATILILVIDPSIFPELIRFFFGGMPFEIGGWVALFVFEGVLLLLVADLFSNLLLFLCVTIGALIVKRAKLVVGLAIYYGVNVVLNTVIQIFMYLVIPTSTVLVAQFADMSLHGFLGICALFLFILIAAASTLALTLYSMTLGRMEKKLNLS